MSANHVAIACAVIRTPFGLSRGCIGISIAQAVTMDRARRPAPFRRYAARHGFNKFMDIVFGSNQICLPVPKLQPSADAAQGGARDVQRSSQSSYNLAQRVAFWRRRTSLALQRALTCVVIDNWNAVNAPDGDVSAYRRIASARGGAERVALMAQLTHECGGVFLAIDGSHAFNALSRSAVRWPSICLGWRPIGALLFALALRGTMVAARATGKFPPLALPGYLDDLTIMTPSCDAPLLGHVNVTKCAALVPASGGTRERAAAIFAAAKALVPVCDDGITLMGVPVGTEDFVRAHLVQMEAGAGAIGGSYAADSVTRGRAGGRGSDDVAAALALLPKSLPQVWYCDWRQGDDAWRALRDLLQRAGGAAGIGMRTRAGARRAAPAVAREPGSAQAPPAAVPPLRQAALSRVLDAALAATQLRRLEANELEAVAVWRSGASKGAIGCLAQLPSTDPAETMSPPEFRETLRRHLGVERPAPAAARVDQDTLAPFRRYAATRAPRFNKFMDIVFGSNQSSRGSYNLAQRVAFWRRRTSLALQLQRTLSRVVVDDWNAVIAPDGDAAAPSEACLPHTFLRYPDETLSRLTHGDVTVYIIGAVKNSQSSSKQIRRVTGQIKPDAVVIDRDWSHHIEPRELTPWDGNQIAYNVELLGFRNHCYFRMFDARGLFKRVPVTQIQATADATSTLEALWLLADYLLDGIGLHLMRVGNFAWVPLRNYWDEKVNTDGYISHLDGDAFMEMAMVTPIVSAGRPRRETRRRMVEAIHASPIGPIDELAALMCIGQPFCGMPYFVSTRAGAFGRRDAERWKARAVLQREYHDAFRARNPLLYAAFITEPGVYTAEALQHYLRETGAKTAVVVVGVAHQDAVESHLCGTYGYSMRLLGTSEELPVVQRTLAKGPPGQPVLRIDMPPQAWRK
ncbi:hypothetical protein JKP88DRAFT_273986 [Tribonema minus]|uniref:Uncharacterized protein n=1 Tax=Tribonema minus TaxID=303371 RepID=A0A836CAL8_9STRA|nr:hypothetical protein JKP88DRAFT_273986 [Tribonema minus]